MIRLICMFLLLFINIFLLNVSIVLVLLFTSMMLMNKTIQFYISLHVYISTFLFPTFLSMCTFLIHTVLLVNILKGYSLSFTAKASHRYKRSVKGESLVGRMVSLYIFAVPALLCSSPTVHHNDAKLH